MNLRVTIDGHLEMRPNTFGIRHGLVQAPREIYGLPSSGPDLVLGALRCGRVDYPALFDPSLLEQPTDTFNAYVWPVQSVTTPPPPPPLDHDATLCLVVTGRVPPRSYVRTTPPSLAFSGRPAFRMRAGGSWAFKVPDLPLLVPVQCKITDSTDRGSLDVEARLVTMTGMTPTGYYTRLWLSATSLAPASRRPGQNKRTGRQRHHHGPTGRKGADVTSTTSVETGSIADADL